MGNLNMDFTENIEKNLESMKRLGIKQYVVIGTLDKRTCEFCGEMDGQIFNVEDAIIGINCPPFHKDCRCTIISYFDEETFFNMKRRYRVYKDENDKWGHYEVGKFITYKEWNEKYNKTIDK